MYFDSIEGRRARSREFQAVSVPIAIGSEGSYEGLRLFHKKILYGNRGATLVQSFTRVKVMAGLHWLQKTYREPLNFSQSVRNTQIRN